MSLKQIQELDKLEIEINEAVLDSWPAEDFARVTGFGATYVGYVNRLRGVTWTATKDLLEEESAWDEVASPPYVRQPDSFHERDDGRYDVCCTLLMNSTCANYLHHLLENLPEAFPNEPHKHNLGWMITPMVLDVMTQQVEKHGRLSSPGTAGTVTKDQLKQSGLMPASHQMGPSRG